MKSARADFMLIKLTDCESKDSDIKRPGFDLPPSLLCASNGILEWWNNEILGLEKK